jgi:hypothetical protein
LQSVPPVSLEEMDKVKLMDRTDVKFILPFSQLEGILHNISGNYRVLTIKGERVFSYRTDYFDTPELSMFFDHHNGKLNRFKIRHREYVESKLNFLEVKFKSNKGRVIKDRIIHDQLDQRHFSGFIARHTPYNPKHLNRSVTNHFNRFTLVDTGMKERVTVDFNLSFTDASQRASLNGLVIIEVKQDRVDKDSNIFQVLKTNKVRPAAISKYCIGISLLNSQPKTNNFKSILLKINKISHVELSA